MAKRNLIYLSRAHTLFIELFNVITIAYRTGCNTVYNSVIESAPQIRIVCDICTLLCDCLRILYILLIFPTFWLYCFTLNETHMGKKRL